MNADTLKTARGHYRALRGHERILGQLAEQNHSTVDTASVVPIVEELARLERECPGLVPPFNVAPQRSNGFSFYDLSGVRAHLANTLGRLSVEIESPDAAPVTERREFRFVRDAKLRAILERDYSEIQMAYVARCWKSVIILSGGALEAILLDLVTQDTAAAKASPKAPRQSDVTRWSLSDLINVCVDVGLVTPYASAVSDATRGYRNLVHPGNEIREALTFAEEEARIALTVLQTIHRDLSR